MKRDFLLKGHIIFTPEPGKLSVHQNSYLYCRNGKAAGIFKTLPDKLTCEMPVKPTNEMPVKPTNEMPVKPTNELPVKPTNEMPVKPTDIAIYDYSDRLIIPGLIDLHLHASQYAMCGMGMDVQLLEWLEAYAFCEEAKFADAAYAKKQYDRFTDKLRKTQTTRAAIFATIHRQGTEILMEALAKAGICAYVGKLNMDRNSTDSLTEDTDQSLRETELWIQRTKDRFDHVKPIITPRFVPSCTGKLMQGLGELSQKYHVPVQSHLSENLEEIKWVKSLHPDCKGYADVYKKYDLFGGGQACIMAHCNYSPEDELDMMKKRGVTAVHCPQSNINVSTGIAPVRKILERGVKVGLGTDIAGGASLSMFRAMTDAIQVSKLRWLNKGKTERPLNIAEALYMATKGGSSLFGKAGSFEDGYEFDAVVIDDRPLGDTDDLTLAKRLERAVYLTDDRHIEAKFAAGRRIY